MTGIQKVNYESVLKLKYLQSDDFLYSSSKLLIISDATSRSPNWVKDTRRVSYANLTGNAVGKSSQRVMLYFAFHIRVGKVSRCTTCQTFEFFGNLPSIMFAFCPNFPTILLRICSNKSSPTSSKQVPLLMVYEFRKHSNASGAVINLCDAMGLSTVSYDMTNV